MCTVKKHHWHIFEGFSYTPILVHLALLSNLFKIPAVTFPGPSSYASSNPLESMLFMVFSHNTGDVTCVANSFLIVSGSECGLASTLLITGIRGFLISTLSKTFSSEDTAGAIYSV